MQHLPGLSRGHGQLPMWVTTLLDVCRLMGNYPISYINIAYKAVWPTSCDIGGQLRDRRALLQTVAVSCFQMTHCISRETRHALLQTMTMSRFRATGRSRHETICFTVDGGHVCSRAACCISYGTSPTSQHMPAMVSLWRRVASATRPRFTIAIRATRHICYEAMG